MKLLELFFCNYCMFFWPKVKLNKAQRKQTKKDLECTICDILKPDMFNLI